MADSVEVVEAHANKDDVETEIQAWLDAHGSITSLDKVVPAYEHRDRVGYAFIYTA